MQILLSIACAVVVTVAAESRSGDVDHGLPSYALAMQHPMGVALPLLSCQNHRQMEDCPTLLVTSHRQKAANRQHVDGDSSMTRVNPVLALALLQHQLVVVAAAAAAEEA